MTVNIRGNRLVIPDKDHPENPLNLWVIEQWANSQVVNQVVADGAQGAHVSSIPLAQGAGAAGTGIVTIGAQGGGGGGITLIESTDNTVTVTNGTGPTVDLSVAPYAQGSIYCPVQFPTATNGLLPLGIIAPIIEPGRNVGFPDLGYRGSGPPSSIGNTSIIFGDAGSTSTCSIVPAQGFAFAHFRWDAQVIVTNLAATQVVQAQWSVTVNSPTTSHTLAASEVTTTALVGSGLNHSGSGDYRITNNTGSTDIFVCYLNSDLSVS